MDANELQVGQVYELLLAQQSYKFSYTGRTPDGDYIFGEDSLILNVQEVEVFVGGTIDS